MRAVKSVRTNARLARGISSYNSNSGILEIPPITLDNSVFSDYTLTS
jgi:hypothetical protein